MKRFQLILFKVLPYVVASAVIFAMMYFGSQGNEDSIKAPITAAFSDNSFLVTADQISESYTVATIANTIALPSNATISENYVTINAIYESTGTTSTSGTIIERPSVIDVSDLSKRGVIVHTVVAGESVDSIIKSLKLDAKGVTSNHVRWSNGMKTAALTTGQTLYLPSVAGIVYKIKNGDSYEGIAKKYQCNLEEMIMRNDLENVPVTTDMRILLPGGTLPETERPEYVAPKPKPTTPRTGGYTYVSDSGVRKNRFQVQNYTYWKNMYYSTKSWNNPGAFGNCTWFAWYWRRANMPSNYWLPTGTLGNARSWNSTLASRGFPVGKTPAYGAVVQTSTSGYGHVAVVVGVNPGVSITIQEMNYAGPAGKLNIVYQSTIDWQYAIQYNYIYGK